MMDDKTTIPQTPAEPATENPGAERAPGGESWAAQLQRMIDDISRQAAPVVREGAAKAAELAAVAGGKAGPRRRAPPAPAPPRARGRGRGAEGEERRLNERTAADLNAERPDLAVRSFPVLRRGAPAGGRAGAGCCGGAPPP